MLLYQSINSSQPDHFQIDIYKNFDFLLHLHQDLEFVLMLEGEAEITFLRRTETIRTGQLALILPNQVHGFHTPVYSHMLVCPFAGNYVEDFLLEMRGKEGEKSVFDSSPALNRYLCDIYLSAATPSRLSLKASLYAICDQYLKSVALVPSAAQDDTLMLRILTYIEQNYRGDISIRTMARDLSYNESYLSRFFNDCIHISFRDYINQYRLWYACHLIATQPGMTMARVAMESGFQSIRSFNRCFTKQLGVSPRNYGASRP